MTHVGKSSLLIQSFALEDSSYPLCLDVTPAGARSIVHELYENTSTQILESRFQIITYVVTDDNGQLKLIIYHAVSGDRSKFLCVIGRWLSVMRQVLTPLI